MGSESIEASFLSIFALISFFIFLIISKYSFRIHKGALLDNDFVKPQAFHKYPVTRSGGIGSMICLIIFFYFYYLLYGKILYDYIFISSSMFFIGFLDDLQIKIKPLNRLLVIVVLLYIFIFFLPIKILNIDIPFLKILMNSHLFSSIFVLFCFLFIINGANLIDGFNGLLSINLLIINVVLAYINLNSANQEFSFFITGQIIILLIFLFFNFPYSKIFLGDSGAYLMGSLVALNTIISSFFFCTLLFYIFFEVFFSFFRKLAQNKSPIYPDEQHLHMLSYYKISSFYGKEKGNFINSIFLNLIYLILITPGLYFIESPSLSRYWFFTLLILYMLTYSRLYRLTKY